MRKSLRDGRAPWSSRELLPPRPRARGEGSSWNRGGEPDRRALAGAGPPVRRGGRVRECTFCPDSAPLQPPGHLPWPSPTSSQRARGPHQCARGTGRHGGGPGGHMESTQHMDVTQGTGLCVVSYCSFLTCVLSSGRSHRFRFLWGAVTSPTARPPSVADRDPSGTPTSLSAIGCWAGELEDPE